MKKIDTSELKSNLSVAKRILKITWQQRKSGVILYLSGALLETLSSILTIYASAKLASLLAVFVTTGKTDYIWFWLIVDIVAALFIGVGAWLMQYANRLVYYSLNKWSVTTYMQAMNRVDMNDFYDEQARNRIAKTMSAYPYHVPSLAQILLELVYGLMRFLAIAVVVAQISWWLILVIAAFLIPSLISSSRIAQISWLIWDQKGDDRFVFGGLLNMISEPKKQMELRSMQAGSYLVERVRKMNNSFYAEQEKEYKNASRVSLSSKIFEVGGVAVGSVYLLKQFLGGAIKLDTYFFLSGALLRIGGALNAIFGTLSRLQEPMIFARTYFEVTDTRPRITNIANAQKLSKDVPEIVFSNVSFTYPDKKTKVLENLELVIRPAEHLALVGENGAGKSTIIKLLLRFYRPTSGKILVNGIDLQEIDIDTWYPQLATLFQTFNEYPFPIHENIEIANPTSVGDKKRLQTAGEFGGINKMIKNYKYGWDTVLNSSFKKGTEPSGGQWQRVALSRAFYRQANVLILDEPTSAIDAKAEYDIFNNIFDHYKDKSALIVSHRFSTVRRADRIIVLDKGKIIEQGSHQELMKNKNLYHELFTKQAEGYKD